MADFQAARISSAEASGSTPSRSYQVGRHGVAPSVGLGAGVPVPVAAGGAVGRR